MGEREHPEPLMSAALVKMAMIKKGLGDSPGFRTVYRGTLADLGVTDEAVNDFIKKNRVALEERIRLKETPDKEKTR